MSTIKAILLSLTLTLILSNFWSAPTTHASAAYDFDDLEVGLTASELNLAGVEFLSSDYQIMNVNMLRNQQFLKLHRNILGGDAENALKMKFAMPQKTYDFVFAHISCPMFTNQQLLTVNALYDGQLVHSDTYGGTTPLRNQWREGVASQGQIVFNELEIIAPTCSNATKSDTQSAYLFIDYLETVDYGLVYYPDNLSNADEMSVVIGRYMDYGSYPLLLEPYGDVLRDDAGYPVRLEGNEFDQTPGLIILNYGYFKGHLWYEIALSDEFSGWILADKIEILTPLPTS